MKKKIIIASATVLFAVATVFNLNLLQENSVGDVSLDAIAVMAQAQTENPDLGLDKWTRVSCNCYLNGDSSKFENFTGISFYCIKSAVGSDSCTPVPCSPRSSC